MPTKQKPLPPKLTQDEMDKIDPKNWELEEYYPQFILPQELGDVLSLDMVKTVDFIDQVISFDTEDSYQYHYQWALLLNNTDN